MWEAGEYQHAAQDACISLSEHIKTKAGSHLNERDLVAQVFKPEPPTPTPSRLYFPGNPADKNWQSRQQRLHLLAQGAFAGIRNIAVHVKGAWSERWSSLLSCPSLLDGLMKRSCGPCRNARDRP